MSVRPSVGRGDEPSEPAGLALDPFWRGSVVVGGVWVAAFAVAAFVAQGHDGASTVLNDIVYLVPIAVCTLLSMLAVSRAAAQQRAFWVTMAASNGLWLAGELVWTTYAVVLDRQPPFPSVADALYIMSYLLVLPAIALGFRGRLRGISWGSVVNLFLIVGGLTVAGYSALIGPLLVFGPSLATATGITYPLLGLAILVLLAAVSVGSDDDRTLPVALILVGAAFAVSAVTDAAYTYLTVVHGYMSGNLLNVGWQTEAVLLCLAALLAVRDGASPRLVRHSTADFTNAIVLLVSAATLGALVVAVGDKSVNAPTALAVVATAMAAQFRLYADARRHERRALAQAAANQHLALHDELTGLPNRRLFYDRTAQAVRAARSDGTTFAVLLMDLDGFKEINDTLGHRQGDLLLQEIGSRLTSTLRQADSVARLGGDEFAILLAPIADPTAVDQAAGRVRAVLAQPFEVQGMILDGSASIGVALYPDHGDHADALLQRADVAMYVAKDMHVPCMVYSPELDRHTAGSLAMVSNLRRAVEADDLVLHYQPKVRLSTDTVTGVEALVRWQHAGRGLIYPDDFIPLAEHAGLIKPLTSWVLEAALRQCRQWQEAGLRLPVSVNLSPRSLFDAGLPDDVETLLSTIGVEPDMLELEITEGAVMANPLRALGLLERLHDMGVRLSIDDFGVGYSSLTYLKVLPVREVKIDKSFVVHMLEDNDDEQIVRSTIGLAHNLGLSVVAEGVESSGVRDRLAALGCDVGQRHWFSPALPEHELEQWLLASLRTVA